jgi:hypothetical protein
MSMGQTEGSAQAAGMRKDRARLLTYLREKRILQGGKVSDGRKQSCAKAAHARENGR